MAKKKIDIPRLVQAMQRSRLMLSRFRQERVEMVRQYVGNHWSEEGTSEKVPVNLISQYVSVVGRNLVAQNPRFMLSTFSRQQKPVVTAMQDWMNKEVVKMNLQNTLQRVVIDALFSIGICKVALSDPAQAAAVAWSIAAGQPFAERVDLDDFVFDIHARDFSECGFIGHRYRVPLDIVKNSKDYSSARKELTATSDPLYNLEGDERISVLGRGMYGGDVDEYEDFVDLWEIYMPRHRTVLTLADDSMSGASAAVKNGDQWVPLRKQGWIGPSTGPYHFLCFGLVPGNAMPKSPLQDLMDLHMDANNCYRKIISMTERVKEQLLVKGSSIEAADRVMHGDDGDIIAVENPDEMKQVVWGGTAVQVVQGVAMLLKQLFNEMAGNLDLLAGSGPQSKTAAQDKMLNENAGAGMSDMQDRTVNFVASVGKALGWYFYKDPFAIQKSLHALPAMPDSPRMRQVTPQMRQKAGPFEDIDLRVDPYSLRHQTPQERWQTIIEVVQTLYQPLAAQFQQSGITMDLSALMKMAGMYKDMPDLTDLFTIQAPPQPQGRGGMGGPQDQGAGGMPANTSRTYNRVSMPGRTKQGNDMNMMSQLMGIKPGGNPNGQPMAPMMPGG